MAELHKVSIKAKRGDEGKLTSRDLSVCVDGQEITHNCRALKIEAAGFNKPIVVTLELLVNEVEIEGNVEIIAEGSV